MWLILFWRFLKLIFIVTYIILICIYLISSLFLILLRLMYILVIIKWTLCAVFLLTNLSYSCWVLIDSTHACKIIWFSWLPLLFISYFIWICIDIAFSIHLVGDVNVIVVVSLWFKITFNSIAILKLA
jgi:hypothetical protein